MKQSTTTKKEKTSIFIADDIKYLYMCSLVFYLYFHFYYEFIWVVIILEIVFFTFFNHMLFKVRIPYRNVSIV